MYIEEIDIAAGAIMPEEINRELVSTRRKGDGASVRIPELDGGHTWGVRDAAFFFSK